MSKRFILGAIVTILVGTGLVAFLSWKEEPAGLPTPSKKELSAKYAEVATRLGQPDEPAPAVLVPLKMSQPVRLAVGGLGLADNEQNQQLGDLVTAELTAAPGFNLVERQSLAAVLQELNLSMSGFVRAKDAVRAGKLLKADWFLLGTEAKLNGTNSLVIRVVDARTGILRDAGVVAVSPSPAKLAADVAAFVSQSRQNAASAKTHEYLAVGAFEDLSLNNRQADFPTQLRGYLTAAYQGDNVTLLEREYVDTLLREVGLDLAGLMEESGTNPPPPLQSAFWLVTGQYQSYETTNLQVELKLGVQRIFGTAKHYTIRDLPGEPLGRQIKAAIDEAMNQKTGVITLTRMSEARAQMLIGQELSELNNVADNGNGFAQSEDVSLVWINKREMYAELSAKKHNVEEAIRAFETVLLLEPTNRVAKMYLAACLRNNNINSLDEARNYYREIIDEPIQDKWSGLAQKALGMTFLDSLMQDESPEETLRWYESAAQHATNPPAVNFFRQQAQVARESVDVNTDSSKAQELAESKILMNITNSWLEIPTIGLPQSEVAEIDGFVKTFGTNQAAAAKRLGELYPKLKAQTPDLAPYLLALFVTVQVDTNASLVVEFQQMVDRYASHPDQVFMPDKFWWHIWPAYAWSCDHQLYGTAAKLLESKLAVAALHANHIREVNDTDKLGLAYAYLGTQEWEKALKIFETYSNQPVQVENVGLWGEMFTITYPVKWVAYCRQKLGLPTAASPLEFKMGEPLLCLCSPSTFIADDNGLWVGIGGQLLHLDFDLKTNLVVNLPMDASTPITTLCLTTSNIWIGTFGEGLIEFDKASRQCRHLREKDGLLLDDVSSLLLSGNTLWIGFGQGKVGQPTMPGGLGKLDLTSGHVESFTPSISELEGGNTTEKPTRETVMAFASGASDDIWFITGEGAPHLHQYQAKSNLLKGFQWACTALVGNPKKIFLAQYVSPGLSFLDFKDGQWRNLKAVAELPSGQISALTLDGNNLWVGGMGYIALVDPVQDKVLHFAYVQAKAVDCIQIAGGYVWAQFDWHLYRAPLSALQ